MLWSIPIPGVDSDSAGEPEYLHHRAGREGVHDGAGGRLHFRSSFPHCDPGNAFDFLPQQVDGALEELPVKLLHLSGAFGVPARAFSAGDSAS